jgi:hypothetical protein
VIELGCEVSRALDDEAVGDGDPGEDEAWQPLTAPSTIAVATPTTRGFFMMPPSDAGARSAMVASVVAVASFPE